MFKKGELELLWPFYLAQFIFGLSVVITPYIILYFRELSFSFLQIEILIAVMMVSVFIFEIPTGAIADIFGRKFSVVTGFMILGVTSILISFASNYFLLIFFLAVWGIGQTFISGAEQALVIDLLKKEKREDLTQEFFVKSSSITSIGLVFAPLIASFIVAHYSKSELWLFMGFGVIIGALVILFFVREDHIKPKETIIGLFKLTIKQSKSAISFSAKHSVIISLIFVSIFVMLTRLGDDGWQPLLVGMTMPQEYLGYMYTVLAAILVVTPFLSNFLKKLEPKKSIALIILFGLLVVLTMIFIEPPFYIFAVVVFLVSSVLPSITYPIYQTYIQKYIPSKMRASVMSFQNMVKSLVQAIFLIPAGYFMDLIGPKQVIILTSLFAIPAIIILLKIKDDNF